MAVQLAAQEMTFSGILLQFHRKEEGGRAPDTHCKRTSY